MQGRMQYAPADNVTRHFNVDKALKTYPKISETDC
jgi:hypothetical protein